jgi:hypothetical protein
MIFNLNKKIDTWCPSSDSCSKCFAIVNHFHMQIKHWIYEQQSSILYHLKWMQCAVYDKSNPVLYIWYVLCFERILLK